MCPNRPSDTSTNIDCGMHRPKTRHMKGIKDETGEVTRVFIDNQRFDHQYQ